ncbi:hypothetical protein [Thermococcus chitonophagus]|nr:hypothetical protein [Thermococcus chitonophagus]
MPSLGLALAGITTENPELLAVALINVLIWTLVLYWGRIENGV